MILCMQSKIWKNKEQNFTYNLNNTILPHVTIISSAEYNKRILQLFQTIEVIRTFVQILKLEKGKRMYKEN